MNNAIPAGRAERLAGRIRGEGKFIPDELWRRIEEAVVARSGKRRHFLAWLDAAERAACSHARNLAKEQCGEQV